MSGNAPSLRVWGIDCSSQRLAIVSLWDGQVGLKVVEGGKGELPDRLARLYSGMAEACYQARAFDQEPWAVCVEVPMGRNSQAALPASFGVCLAAIRNALPTTALQWAGPPTWKSPTVGRGNATKDQIKEWAAAQGFESEDQDLIDAFGIATYCQLATTGEVAA